MWIFDWNRIVRSHSQIMTWHLHRAVTLIEAYQRCNQPPSKVSTTTNIKCKNHINSEKENRVPDGI